MATTFHKYMATYHLSDLIDYNRYKGMIKDNCHEGDLICTSEIYEGEAGTAGLCGCCSR